jgi:hypothetical protein
MLFPMRNRPMPAVTTLMTTPAVTTPGGAR